MDKKILTERTALFDPNMYIEFLFEIKGNPTEQMLCSAIKQAYHANEATMSKVKIGLDGVAVYQSLDECRCTVTFTDEAWLDIIKKNEKIPFKIQEGELVKTFIINSNNKIFILIMAHHLAGDGKAIVYFIEDFMSALSGKALTTKPMLLFTKDTLSQMCKTPWLTRLYANQLNKRWEKAQKHFSIDDYYKLHNFYWKSHESIVLRKRYTREELFNLRRNAKEQGLSLNNLIIAAFLKANSQMCNAGVAVNARMNGNKSMSNQASGITVSVKYNHKKSVYENAKAIQRSIQAKLKTPLFKYFILNFISVLSPALVDSVLFQAHGILENPVSKKLADMLGYTYKKDRQLSFSNLTKIDILQKYGEFEIKDIWFVPPVVSYGKRIIGVISDEDGMSVVYHFMNDLDVEKESRIFDLASTNLSEEAKAASKEQEAAY